MQKSNHHFVHFTLPAINHRLCIDFIHILVDAPDQSIFADANECMTKIAASCSSVGKGLEEVLSDMEKAAISKTIKVIGIY